MKNNFQKKEKNLSELLQTFEQLSREYQQLLEELGLTSEQLQTYIENPKNFTPAFWQQLQNEKERLDEQLNIELSNFPDPFKTKKSFSERGAVQQHWLFVR